MNSTNLKLAVRAAEEQAATSDRKRKRAGRLAGVAKKQARKAKANFKQARKLAKLAKAAFREAKAQAKAAARALTSITARANQAKTKVTPTAKRAQRKSPVSTAKPVVKVGGRIRKRQRPLPNVAGRTKPTPIRARKKTRKRTSKKPPMSVVKPLLPVKPIRAKASPPQPSRKRVVRSVQPVIRPPRDFEQAIAPSAAVSAVMETADSSPTIYTPALPAQATETADPSSQTHALEEEPR
jgi:hypothetical protein